MKNLDMLHATDYVNMDVESLDQKLTQSKKNDELYSQKMQ